MKFLIPDSAEQPCAARHGCAGPETRMQPGARSMLGVHGPACMRSRMLCSPGTRARQSKGKKRPSWRAEARAGQWGAPRHAARSCGLPSAFLRIPSPSPPPPRPSPGPAPCRPHGTWTDGRRQRGKSAVLARGEPGDVLWMRPARAPCGPLWRACECRPRSLPAGRRRRTRTSGHGPTTAIAQRLPQKSNPARRPVGARRGVHGVGVPRVAAAASARF